MVLCFPEAAQELTVVCSDECGICFLVSDWLGEEHSGVTTSVETTAASYNNSSLRNGHYIEVIC